MCIEKPPAMKRSDNPPPGNPFFVNSPVMRMRVVFELGGGGWVPVTSCNYSSTQNHNRSLSSSKCSSAKAVTHNIRGYWGNTKGDKTNGNWWMEEAMQADPFRIPVSLIGLGVREHLKCSKFYRLRFENSNVKHS